MRAVGLLSVVLAVCGCRGKELARMSLRGEVKTGFEGSGTYPAKTKRVHLYYDAVWMGSKELPEGSLTLEAPGRTITCPLKPDGGAVCETRLRATRFTRCPPREVDCTKWERPCPLDGLR